MTVQNILMPLLVFFRNGSKILGLGAWQMGYQLFESNCHVLKYIT